MDNQMQRPPQQQGYLQSQVNSELTQQVASLVKLLLESGNTINTLRRELRGEGLHQSDDGKTFWMQVSKPTFVRMDYETNKPLKTKITTPDGEEREIYEVNDEAIEEVLSMYKSMGINQITPLTNIHEDIIRDDLKEFECKLASVLCLKQKAWGIDKALLPILQSKIKTLIQDARYQARDGVVLKALQTTVSRIEQVSEGEKAQRKINTNPYS